MKLQDLRVDVHGWKVAEVETCSRFSRCGQNFATPVGDYAGRMMSWSVREKHAIAPEGDRMSEIWCAIS